MRTQTKVVLGSVRSSFMNVFRAIWASVYLFIYHIFFVVGVRLFDSICCSRVSDWRPGECSMYEINERHISEQPKNIVRHAHATIYFLFASNAWEKIFFSSSVCDLSLVFNARTFTTIINNLLFSLQIKFPFFFFFHILNFTLMDPYAGTYKHATKILRYSTFYIIIIIIWQLRYWFLHFIIHFIPLSLHIYLSCARTRAIHLHFWRIDWTSDPSNCS